MPEATTKFDIFDNSERNLINTSIHCFNILKSIVSRLSDSNIIFDIEEVTPVLSLILLLLSLSFVKIMISFSELIKLQLRHFYFCHFASVLEKGFWFHEVSDSSLQWLITVGGEFSLTSAILCAAQLYDHKK
jgi:hypothetical protein